MIWETVIGLEVHAQLKTQSKLFSGAATTFGAPANTQASFIDVGLPGVLPVLNQEAVRMAVQFGLAINAKLHDLSYFERKNYFYPDLPKGYQISQHRRPIVGEGSLEIETSSGLKKISIVRAHLEEDAGKSLHELQAHQTGIDLNRAGTPLLEIVTAPCLSSIEETTTYLKTLHQLLRFLDICDGNMQEGSFRCDVNISLKAKGQSALGTRVEIKNLNSFRFIEKAIAHEQARQQEWLETGQTIIQETRLYAPNTDSTYPLRSKENENDYRYFPDPDLLPIEISAETIECIRSLQPKLPQEWKKLLLVDTSLSLDDIEFLLSSPALIQYFEALSRQTKASKKIVANWLKGPYARALNEAKLSFEQSPIALKDFACLLDRVEDQTISNHHAKKILNTLMEGAQDVDTLIASEGFKQDLADQSLENLIQKIIALYPQQACDYRAGKEKLLSFFVGQVMKETRGKANPAQIHALLQSYLR